MLYLVEGGVVFVFMKILLELLPEKAFKADNLNFDDLILVVILSNVDAIFVESSMSDTELLGVLKGFENL
ncbi:MAG: hypothetical protein ACK521_06705 [bacterium]